MAMLSDRGSTPLISTNAYYGNGLASHTVKNLVNMRVLGFLNQFGRFTPFLFSCLFCQLFANFSKISRAKFANFSKVWKAAPHLGLRPPLVRPLRRWEQSSVLFAGRPACGPYGPAMGLSGPPSRSALSTIFP